MKKLMLVFIIVFALVLISVSCSDNGDGTSVEIISFSASETDVLALTSITLSWEVTGATKLTISPEIGDVSSLTSIIVYPTKDTTYTLLAENSDNSDSATTTVKTSPAGYVYISNPITATGDGTLRDNNDQTTRALETSRTQVALKYLDGSGKLVGTYADLGATGINHSQASGYQPPSDYTLGTAWTQTESYHFTRDSYAFSEVNCYYHVSFTHDMLSEMGFGDINNRSVPIDAFYFPGMNAFYSSSDKGLHFGYHYTTNNGTYYGPDATEDAEVVVHEFGHCIQDDEFPNWGYYPAQGAMGEGFSDFIGQLGSQDPRFPYYEAEWFMNLYPAYTSSDGIPYMRPLNMDWIFPYDLGMVFIDDATYGTGVYYEVHYDGIFWSSTLMALHDLMKSIHGDSSTKALAITLQSHYDGPQTFRAAAMALLSANQDLYDGEDDAEIRAELTERGFFNNPGPPIGYPETVLAPNVSQQLATYAPLCHYAKITIGENVSHLTISTSVEGDYANSDLDIYVRKNGVHFYEYDYSATSSSGNETLVLDNPSAGTYGILIHSFSYDGHYGPGMVQYTLLAETS